MKDEIYLAELESKLSGQVHSLRVVELEMLKLRKKQDDYSATIKSINMEIEKTKIDIREAKLKGGEIK